MREIVWILLSAVTLAAPLFAQEPGRNLFQLQGGIGQVEPKAKTEVTAALVPTDKPTTVTLQVKLALPDGANTYSQNPDLPKPTRITVDGADGWTALDKEFTPDHPPKKEFDENFGMEVEKFYGTVVFSRRYAAPPGTNIKTASLSGEVSFLVCDQTACRPQREKFTAPYSAKNLMTSSQVGVVPDVAAGLVRPAQADLPLQASAKNTETAGTVFAYQLVPQASRAASKGPQPVRLQFELAPANAQPGETVTLAITMTLDDRWTTYDLKPADETQIESPTAISVIPKNLQVSGDFISVPSPQVHETTLSGEVHRSNTFEHRVTWMQSFVVLDAAPYGVEGSIRYQICEKEKTCLPPNRVPFALGNAQTAALAGAEPISESFTQLTSPVMTAVPAAQGSPEPALSAAPQFDVAAQGADLTLAGALLSAFLVGLLMNVLPCVLPVLAIKILSLVQQAGESRFKVIGLNFAYTAGVMAVFLTFAVLSWGLGHSLAATFQSTTFWIVMACVVFAMGLSLFGLFELPVPGIIPSAGHHSEGYIGAFNTGIIATLLGTPCIGPFIAPVFTWCLAQPATIVFATFGMMGIGMASPFLVTAFFPVLVSWVPRPGAWMVTFKQFTGFVLMGTVIWILFQIDMAWRLPVLVLLLALALLVWMSTHLAAPTDPLGRKLRSFVFATIAAAPIFGFGLMLLFEFQPAGALTHSVADGEMPWQPFSEEQLVKLRAEGKPMLIDFTANWCVICKINEKAALNRDETVKFVRENGFVPLLADFTQENAEILKWLRQFGQDSVPLTIIIPPGKDSQIIALRGQYTQSMLLEKLNLAVGSTADAAEVRSVPAASRAVSATTAARPETAGLSR